MPSYLRKLFGDSTNQPSRPPTSKTDRYPQAHFVDVYPRGTAQRPETSHHHRSTRSTTPSPLGPPTSVDTRTAYGYGKAPRAASSGPSELRPQLLRRTGYNSQSAAPHPSMHAYSAGVSTPASSRSNSSTSIYAMNSAPYPHEPMYHGTPARPSLPSGNSWQSASSGSSYHHPQPVSYVQTRPSSLHMHPLLAYTRLHHAPLEYDVTFTPSARTVLDRTTHTAIPSHTLAEPATDPPTPSSARLILRSHKFPWTIVVTDSSPRFTVGPAKYRSKALVITILDLLYAVHTTLLTQVTPEEWESLGHGSRAQQKVTKAYERRCTRMGGGWEGGVRRIDWLGEKTKLVGVEVDKSAGCGKLVFSKA